MSYFTKIMSQLIVGAIKGLFFSARLLSDLSLPPSSPFGNIRMMIPGQTLLDPNHVRLYFCDFYCNYITHYVTIVVCERGSETDRFCERVLVPIAHDTNPFLRIERNSPFENSYEFWVNRNVWVEIYYTEDVPLHFGRYCCGFKFRTWTIEMI